VLVLLGGCGEDEAADAPPRVAARIEVAEPIADDAVVRIDPETKRIVARIPVGKGGRSASVTAPAPPGVRTGRAER
jgi:hypothetical protein